MMSDKVIITKYGRAKVNKYGHVQITSSKEGNYGKYLHRLIGGFHDFVSCGIINSLVKDSI